MIYNITRSIIHIIPVIYSIICAIAMNINSLKLLKLSAVVIYSLLSPNMQIITMKVNVFDDLRLRLS